MKSLCNVFLLIVLSVGLYSQSEKVVIEGAVVISNYDGSMPQKGTMRYDSISHNFEGWNGIRWVSFSTGLSEGLINDISGNLYRTLPIGNQIWFIDNLRTTKYSNGDIITDGTGIGDISAEIQPKFWFANNDDFNKVTLYGLLYTWYVGEDSRNVCPFGWHVPSDADWLALENFLGGSVVAGGMMKEEGTIQAGTGQWLEPNKGGTNISGFSGRPAGYRMPDGTFHLGITEGYFWTVKGVNAVEGSVRSLLYNSRSIGSQSNLKGFGLSVRCIKDSP